MQLTKRQFEIIEVTGPLLVTGGPGSGKTTISIIKASQIAERELSAGQRILFLSFARATVSRVVETIEYEQRIPPELKRRIDVETYHSFFWRLLKTHGYLLGLPRKLSILAPPAEAIALSTIRSAYTRRSKLSDDERAKKQVQESRERVRLATEEGRVCFDCFAPYAAEILRGSNRIRNLIATMYPVIILDEFQDTNEEQWRIVQYLGMHSTLVALADPEQRIHDWLGANPERLRHFREAFAPREVDLGSDNHRSLGTDIGAFGDDLLTGRFRDQSYRGVTVLAYEPNADQARTALVTTTYAARKRVTELGSKSWSLAILVPTKKMTRLVSDTFRSPPAGMSEIRHTAVIEREAAILGTELIAFLMQPDMDRKHCGQFIGLLSNYFRGKGGDSPTKRDIEESKKIVDAYSDWLDREATGKKQRAGGILVATMAEYLAVRSISLIGQPDRDWRAIRSLLEAGQCLRLRGLAEETRNIRLLERGTQLRQDLAQDWSDSGAYANSLTIVRRAFVQEHFSTNGKPEAGVVVMNMHKAKGKQFDEVIIFEGWPTKWKGKTVANLDRIVRENSREGITSQARQNLRVSITRGKRHATILTPKSDPCILIRKDGRADVN